MINLFGYPVLVTKMPNHEIIKSAFEPFFDDDVFDLTSSWDCNCTSTFEKNDNNLPWNFFFANVNNILNEYLDALSFDEQQKQNIKGYAWANRYKINQHQEIHNHSANNNFVSCAYMLQLPKNSGSFSFYKSNYNIFPTHLLNSFTNHTILNQRAEPNVNEGDIIIFPSSLDHYVTYHKSNDLRISISCNFSLDQC